MPVFHRVVMEIVRMVVQIVFIADGMLNEAWLPDSAPPLPAISGLNGLFRPR
jgi:hypothetical protein